jgi:hypothetical protein
MESPIQGENFLSFETITVAQKNSFSILFLNFAAKSFNKLVFPEITILWRKSFQTSIGLSMIAS